MRFPDEAYTDWFSTADCISMKDGVYQTSAYGPHDTDGSKPKFYREYSSLDDTWSNRYNTAAAAGNATPEEFSVYNRPTYFRGLKVKPT